MAERRRLDLCYNCDEKFCHNHNCKRLFFLAWDGEVDPGEEAAIDILKEASTLDETPEISLHALTGVRTNKTMQVKAHFATLAIKNLSHSLTRAQRTTSC